MQKRPSALFLLILLLSLCSCSGLIKNVPSGIIQGKEIYGGRSYTFPRPIWCGLGSELVYMPDFGDIASYDIMTGERLKIAERSIMPLTCTPDGERLIYLESKGIGWEDDSIEEETMGLWSYDFEAKAHRLLAIVYTNEVAPFAESILSPDGNKLLLGKRPKKSVEKTESTPEIIWSDTKRTASSITWLADSSGVVKSYWNEKLGRDVIDVSTFAPEKKAVTIDPHSKEILLSPVSVDGVVYMKALDGNSSGAREILKCALYPEKQDASCEVLLKSGRDIIDFYILPDGKTVVFTEKSGRCVKIFERGDEKPRCITPPGEHFLHNFSVSPDARLVAYIVDDKLYYRPFETEPKWEDSSGIFKEDEEGVRIERFKEDVRRDGDTLYLKTESGAYRTYTNLQGCDPLSWCFYEFIDYFEDLGFYVVFMRTHEGWNHSMISDRDGEEYFVNDHPILSSDKERIVAVASDDLMGLNGIFIWHISDGKLSPELSYKPTPPGPYTYYYFFKRWKDNKTIEVYRRSGSDGKLCPETKVIEFLLTVRLEDGTWSVYDDPKTQPLKCVDEIEG